MRIILSTLVFLFVCSCSENKTYYVKEHKFRVPEHYEFRGYECSDFWDNSLKLCETKEECNTFCDQVNNKGK